MKRQTYYAQLLVLLAVAWLVGCGAPNNSFLPASSVQVTSTPSAAQTSPTVFGPPPATLVIDNKEQVSGIGSYCWSDSTRGECADAVGVPTPQEPLVAHGPSTARLRLPLDEVPSTLQLQVASVTQANELDVTARGNRWWGPPDALVSDLPLQREQDLELTLAPGLYVLQVLVSWTSRGSVTYGFLVQMQ